MEYYYSGLLFIIICDAGEIDWISFWMDVERIGRQIDDDVTAHFCTTFLVFVFSYTILQLCPLNCKAEVNQDKQSASRLQPWHAPSPL